MKRHLAAAKLIQSTRHRLYTTKLRAQKFSYRLRQPPLANKQVIFVLGFQRSGTTMLLDILNKSMDVDAYREHDRRAFTSSFQLRGKESIAPLISRSNARCVAFKPICDSHKVISLLEDYVGSKGIWIYRDYQDVANSAVARWNNHAFEVLRDTVAGKMIWGWRQEAISQDTLARIKKAWQPDMSPHEAFALFWYQRNQLFFDFELEKNSRILLIRYENLVAQPEKFFPQIFEFAGLPFSQDVISDIFITSVRKQEFPAAHPDIIAMCDDMLSRLNQVADI